ncbi:thiazole synthase [Clostridium sp. 19966]|uniref:thiazole synthase n=1 Tax=Clostridium sp. 19966 TaxID=2768166 RepID=UPI0028DDE408|nr:thiazole synthase [Clostridium sp. 19966]MDT8718924.1 thiazole synthase [Clostridium sp. 19966]
MDELVIGGKVLKSRLFVGTGKYSSNKMVPDIIKASGTNVVTAALRRVNLSDEEENILNYIDRDCIIMPNTSGARSAEEAVRLARIARAAGCGDWVKIEIISDNKYLLPDNYETIKATEMLAKEGFVVLPYMNPDLMDARRMVEAGASAVMPLGSPIGSNRGLKTREIIRILIEEIKVPIVVDAGIGKPSDATEAMEMGAAAVLANTALATAGNPVLMAEAFKYAVEAGRKGFLARLGAEKSYAEASSPLTGFLR